MVACVAEKLNPGIVHLQTSDKKFVAPHVLPGFSIIASYWLLYMPVFSYTVIGQIDLIKA